MISPRQKRIYEFIKGYISSNGQAPTFQEIGDYFGYSSTATVHRIVGILEGEGLITRKRKAWRCIQLVGA